MSLIIYAFYNFSVIGIADCDFSMGLTDGTLHDSAFTSSSVSPGSSPAEARVQPLSIQGIPKVGWIPGSGSEEWIQVVH